MEGTFVHRHVGRRPTGSAVVAQHLLWLLVITGVTAAVALVGRRDVASRST